MAYPQKTSEADRLLREPHSIEAEHAVLGSVLRSQEALHQVLEIIDRESHFHAPKNRLVFRAILDLYERNEPVDITTVAEALNRSGDLQKAGGRVYLAELIESVASTANVAAHAYIVLDKSILRQLIATSESIITSAYQQQDDVSDMLDRAERAIFDIAETKSLQSFVSLRDLLPKTFQQIEEIRSGEGAADGVMTGFESLDVMTNGLHKGELIIVAGRPSMGKSALVMNIAEYVAMEQKKKVCVFSVEMSADQLAIRMLCARAKVSQQKLRSGRVTDEEMQWLARAGVLSEAQIFIDDTPGLTTLGMKAKARRLKSQHGVDLVIVDYIQMMTGGGRFENRQQEIASLSRNLKTLAMELETPVIACSQLSRQVEQREGRKPQLSDLRESGAIEQDADVVMFVYRPEYYFSHQDKTDPKYQDVVGKAEIIVAKQRNGPTGTVHLAFLKDFARFENMTQRPEGLPDDVEPIGPHGLPF
jgi:replicative DNA helicase